MKSEEYWKVFKYLEETDIQNYKGYYNGYKLLKKKDLNDEFPEIILSAGNRTAGKTFFWKRLITRFCLHTCSTFLCVCRKRPTVKGSAKAFFEDISNCLDLCGEWKLVDSDVSGVIGLAYNNTVVGYFTYYNFADQLKEQSNLFNNTTIFFKDEFQALDGKYVEEEIVKFRTIHRSLARGYGEHIRFVLTILAGNQITLVNPYYIALGIHKRLQANTKFLRGSGWVLEITLNKVASDAAKESPFEKAFGEDELSASDNDNVYMDNMNFVGHKNTGKMRQQFVFIRSGKPYGVWYSGSYYYVSSSTDPNCKRRYAIDLKSHTDGTHLLRSHDPIFQTLKQYFDKGYFYFEDIESKVACIELFAVAIL